MSLRGNVALTGGAALAAGLLLGFIVERLRHSEPLPATGVAPDTRPPVRKTPSPSTTAVEPPVSDVLERYRLAAAV
jgi:hypothetical protein